MQKSILVVEDDIDIREAIAFLLEDEGYEVTCVCDGTEALTYLHDGHTPSLIVLDIMMPGMDGYAFREAQEREPAIAGIPVILLSASINLAQRARSMGVAAALEKPIRVEQLVKTIEALCAPTSDHALSDRSASERALADRPSSECAITERTSAEWASDRISQLNVRRSMGAYH